MHDSIHLRRAFVLMAISCPFGKRHKPSTLFTHIPAVRLSTVSSGVRQALHDFNTITMVDGVLRRYDLVVHSHDGTSCCF